MTIIYNIRYANNEHGEHDQKFDSVINQLTKNNIKKLTNDSDMSTNNQDQCLRVMLNRCHDTYGNNTGMLQYLVELFQMSSPKTGSITSDCVPSVANALKDFMHAINDIKVKDKMEHIILIGIVARLTNICSQYNIHIDPVCIYEYAIEKMRYPIKIVSPARSAASKMLIATGKVTVAIAFCSYLFHRLCKQININYARKILARTKHSISTSYLKRNDTACNLITHDSSRVTIPYLVIGTGAHISK